MIESNDVQVMYIRNRNQVQRGYQTKVLKREEQERILSPSMEEGGHALKTVF